MNLDRTRAQLSRRIDRCYRIAAWTRVAAKRVRYLELARHYRSLLANLQAAPTPGLA